MKLTNYLTLPFVMIGFSTLKQFAGKNVNFWTANGGKMNTRLGELSSATRFASGNGMSPQVPGTYGNYNN